MQNNLSRRFWSLLNITNIATSSLKLLAKETDIGLKLLKKGIP